MGRRARPRWIWSAWRSRGAPIRKATSTTSSRSCWPWQRTRPHYAATGSSTSRRSFATSPLGSSHSTVRDEAFQRAQLTVDPFRIAVISGKHEQSLQRGDDQRGELVRLRRVRDGTLFGGVPQKRGERLLPGGIDVTDDRCDRAIAATTHRELAHDDEEVRVGPGETPDTREVRTQLFAGRARRLESRAEASHRVSDDAPDQLLLRRVVVVQRRDVDADFCGDVARSQPLEATLGEELIGRLDECL